MTPRPNITKPRVFDMATPPNMPRFPGTALEAHSEAGQGRPRPGGAHTPQWFNGKWPPSGKPDLKLVAEMARLYGKSDIVSFDIEGEWQHTHKMPREQFDAAVAVKIDTLKAANDANPRAQFGVYATIPHDPYLMTQYAEAKRVRDLKTSGGSIIGLEWWDAKYDEFAKQFDHWQETCRACTELAKASDFATFVGYSTGKSDNESNDIRNDGIALAYGITEAKRFGRAVYVYLSPYLDGELNNGRVGEKRFQASCEKAKSLGVNVFVWFYTLGRPLDAYETACMKIAVGVYR